jgi:predicted lipoprotein with Yx(FWY)xxD motif
LHGPDASVNGWPESSPQAGNTATCGRAVSAAMRRRRPVGGDTQVTYAGHPLYYFSAGQQPGDISGEGTQGFGGGWDLVSPAGKKVEKPGE